MACRVREDGVLVRCMGWCLSVFFLVFARVRRSGFGLRVCMDRALIGADCCVLIG